MKLTNIELAKEYLQKAYKAQINGKIDLAIANYIKSIEYCPTAEAYTFLGWAYSIKGDFNKAIENCKIAIDLDPEFGNSYNDIGAYLIQQGYYDEALFYLEKAISSKKYLTPEYPHFNLGKIYERKGQWFEALKEYKKSMELAPNYTMAIESYYRIQSLLN